MSEPKHTPGPWFIGALESGQAAVDAASGDVTGWVSIPDAHLIAAAPDLYSALVEFLSASNVPEIMTREETLRLIRAEDAARAAIKKARGES